MAEPDRVHFGRAKAEGRPVRGVWGLVVSLLVGLALIGATRTWWQPRTPPGVLIEVRGEVARPGLHLVPTPTLSSAVEAAGGDGRGLASTPLAHGDRVEVRDGVATILPPGEPLLVGLPIDLSTAEASALKAIPGLSAATADAIIAHRAEHGPFRSLADLRQVPGVGPSTVERIAPFVSLGEVLPLDLNAATVGELERLPGIGPVLAARIVVDRADRGPFGVLEDLARVQGIGPSQIDALRGHVRLSAP